MNEWSGSILTGETALTNSERLALWILKRGDKPLFLKAFKKPVKEIQFDQPKYRAVAGGLVKNCITGEVHQPLTRYYDEDWWT
jgi:hypothetical protein